MQLGSAILPAAAVGRLSEALLAELPGRLWEGKEALLTALGALAKAYTGEHTLAGGVPASAGRTAAMERFETPRNLTPCIELGSHKT